MSFKQVKELRQKGQLTEALAMAEADLQENSENIWNKRSIAWVYYEYLKGNSDLEHYDNFINYLQKLKELELPEDEHMIFDTCAYQLGKMVHAISKSEPANFSKAQEILTLIRDFHFSKPSEAYSFLYKMVHQLHEKWNGFLAFADWWNFDNFRPEDYQQEEYNGQKIMSIVEQAYIAYAKKLLEAGEREINGLHIPAVVDQSKVVDFISKLDILIGSHPEYQYPPYFKAKLLLSLGDKENVLSAFIPFARKKRNDFWVWTLLSETFPTGDPRIISCICKALTLKTPEEFLTVTREKLASLLIEQKKYDEAITEIAAIVKVKTEQQRKISHQVDRWMNMEWYKSASVLKNNESLYQQHSHVAEEILFGDVPEEAVVVVYVNENKSMVNFVRDETKSGFFNYSAFVKKLTVGDILLVRFNDEGKNDFYKALSVKVAPGDTPCKAIKNFTGNVSIYKDGAFGIVNNIYIDATLLQKYQLNANDLIKGKAMLTFNKKKNEWGWKAIELSFN